MDNPPVTPVPTPINLARYMDDPLFEHEDFTLTSACTLRARASHLRHSQVAQLFKPNSSSQEYSWEDHGFPYLNSLYPQMSELLDEKFKITYELTYRL